jgi:hypothetical protein
MQAPSEFGGQEGGEFNVLLLSQEGEGSSVGAGSPWVVRVVKHAFAFNMNVFLLSAFARLT